MDGTAPTVDLLTWIFGNPKVGEDDFIFINANGNAGEAASPDRLTGQVEVEGLRKGQVRTLVRQLVAGFTRLSGTCPDNQTSTSTTTTTTTVTASTSTSANFPPSPCSLSPSPSSSTISNLSSSRNSNTPSISSVDGTYTKSPASAGNGVDNTCTTHHLSRPRGIITRRAPGLVVCVHSFNDIVYPALFLGVVGAGGQWTGSNPAYTVGELTHHLRTSSSTHVITGLEGLDTAVAAARDCGIPLHHVYVLNPPQSQSPPGIRSWTELLQHGESDWIKFDDGSRAKNTTIALFSTSGTTGLPKMAERSHHSFVAESFALRDARPKSYRASRLIAVPMFHAFASALALVSALRDGCPTFVMRRFNRQQFLHALHQHQITETALVPPLFLDFLQYTPAEQEKFRSLHSVYCGGSPLDTVTQGKALQLFAPNARIVQVWGMTECGWITTFQYPESDNTGSVGRLIHGYQARCVDDNGHDVTSEDDSGEILVKGPTLMRGYLNDAQATRTTIDGNGWLHTGDIGFIRQGKVYIVDRKKELIKVRGWQIAPAELEATLLLHPSITDAAVIGVPSSSHPGSMTTEIPRAYVVRAPGIGSCLQKTDVKVFLLQHLARYKVSECEVRFRDEIPKSVSGKILRKMLRAEAAEEVAAAAGKTPKAWGLQPGCCTITSASTLAGNNAANSTDMLLFSQFAGLLYALWQWIGGARVGRVLAESLGKVTASSLEGRTMRS